jgi:hypothetical protein
MKTFILIVFTLFAGIVAHLFVGCSADYPYDYDLRAESLKYAPNPVHVGDKVVFDYSIKNVGTNPVMDETYTVELSVDKESSAIPGSRLEPGKTFGYGMAKGYYHWKPTNAGRFHYRFYINCTGFPEKNKKDNVIEGDIDVLP